MSISNLSKDSPSITNAGIFEKVAIASVLIDLMNADGNVDFRETLYMNQLRNNLNISEEEIKEGKEQNLLVSFLVLGTMNNEKKYTLAIMLTEMIKADGKEDVNEIKYFNVVANAIGMKQAIEELKK